MANQGQGRSRNYRVRQAYVPSGHPLAARSRLVGTARLILWDKIGPGWHRCHFCRAYVKWKPGATLSEPHVLIAARIDRDSSNDSPENIAPCCRRCLNQPY